MRRPKLRPGRDVFDLVLAAKVYVLSNLIFLASLIGQDFEMGRRDGCGSLVGYGGKKMVDVEWLKANTPTGSIQREIRALV